MSQRHRTSLPPSFTRLEVLAAVATYMACREKRSSARLEALAEVAAHAEPLPASLDTRDDTPLAPSTGSVTTLLPMEPQMASSQIPIHPSLTTLASSFLEDIRVDQITARYNPSEAEQFVGRASYGGTQDRWNVALWDEVDGAKANALKGEGNDVGITDPGSTITGNTSVFTANETMHPLDVWLRADQAPFLVHVLFTQTEYLMEADELVRTMLIGMSLSISDVRDAWWFEYTVNMLAVEFRNESTMWAFVDGVRDCHFLAETRAYAVFFSN